MITAHTILPVAFEARVRMLEPLAVRVAMRSPCAKSKRGVLVVSMAERDYPSCLVGVGHNAQPDPYACDSSDACRAACGKLCVHAEAAALRDAGGLARRCHLIHVKAVDGMAVPSGPPSCWQCSREILSAGISTVWLLHESGWTPYPAAEFHRLTLEHERLPVLRGGTHG
jgi:deoxycytidylate deaminase